MGVDVYSNTLPTYSQILRPRMRNEINTRLRRIGNIRLHRLPKLDRPILHRTPHRNTGSKPLQPIRAAQNREVGERDLVRVPRDDRWHPVILCLDGRFVDVQLEVAAVVDLGPLQFAVCSNQGGAGFYAGGEGNVLSVGGGGGYRYSKKRGELLF